MIAKAALDQLVARAADDGIEKLVVGAIVRTDDSVLLLQRRYSGLAGSVLELPMGAVRRGETLSEALIRGLSVTTGLVLTNIDEYVGSFDYLAADGKRCRQLNFTVSVAVFEPIRLQRHHAYRWLPLDSELPVTRSMREIFQKYRNTRCA